MVFEIPAGKYKNSLVDIPSLMKTNKELKNALEQVQQYCSKRGVALQWLPDNCFSGIQK